MEWRQPSPIGPRNARSRGARGIDGVVGGGGWWGGEGGGNHLSALLRTSAVFSLVLISLMSAVTSSTLDRNESSPSGAEVSRSGSCCMVWCLISFLLAKQRQGRLLTSGTTGLMGAVRKSREGMGALHAHGACGRLWGKGERGPNRGYALNAFVPLFIPKIFVPSLSLSPTLEQSSA